MPPKSLVNHGHATRSTSHTYTDHKLVVLGLDGLPYSLACTLTKAGHCPNLGRLLASAQATSSAPQSHAHQAYAGPMHAELPELSPVNWTSFYTGQGPEEHGVFGFTRINAANYALSLADFTQVHIPTIFDILGTHGYTSRIINLPNTYPARGLHAPKAGASTMLISGFVAHDIQHAVFPPFLLGPLMGAGYMLEADTSRGSGDPYYLLQELKASLASRRAALALFWPDLAWHCFVYVLTETDRLFHFLWDAVADSTNPLHEPCMDFIRHWDACIGDVLQRIDLLQEQGHKVRLMVMADHGFTELETEVDLNVWLQDEGLLHLGPSHAEPQAHHDPSLAELDASRILPQSRAFALDPSRIYIHTKERFARGLVTQAEAPMLIAHIRERLMGITYQGRPVMKAVHTADELYTGSKRAMAPDLVCVPHRGFDLKAKFNRTTLFGHFGRTGTHSVGDAFFYDSHGFQAQRVRDVGQAVLAHFEAAQGHAPLVTSA